MRQRRTKNIAGERRGDCRRQRAAGTRAPTNLVARLDKRAARRTTKLKDRDLVFILRNLATLTESGVSLPKALGTLAEEKALEKHRDMLQSIRRHLENGETLQLGPGPVRRHVRHRDGQPDQGGRTFRHAGRNADNDRPPLRGRDIGCGPKSSASWPTR